MAISLLIISGNQSGLRKLAVLGSELQGLSCDVRSGRGPEALEGLADSPPDVVVLYQPAGMDAMAMGALVRQTLESTEVLVLADVVESRHTLAGLTSRFDVFDYRFAEQALGHVVRRASTKAGERQELLGQLQFARETAFSAMRSMGELGTVLEFLKASFSCAENDKLAELLLYSTEQYGLDSIVRLTTLEGDHVHSRRGCDIGAEVDLMQAATVLGRIYESGDQGVYNYGRVTLIVSGCPLGEDERGRLRDNLAILCQGADACLAALEQTHRLQHQKMQSLGQLAAGLAHEINNPIGFVRSNMSVLENYSQQLLSLVDQCAALNGTASLEDYQAAIEQGLAHIDLSFIREDLGDLLNESKSGLDRVTRIVRELKSFSHVDREVNWSAENLNQALDHTLSVVAGALHERCEVTKEYDVLPPVECLLPELNQVFMHLILNAVHAVGEKGRLHLQTQHVGERVQISMTDNGCGIPGEYLGRLFDPFFTTRSVGAGVGLGLSVVYGIVKRHGGRIEVESEQGKGSCFRITLPVRRTGITVESVPKAAMPSAHQGIH